MDDGPIGQEEKNPEFWKNLNILCHLMVMNASEFAHNIR